MINQLKNRIEATDCSINTLLKGQKFYIDYFQREYRWQEKHIKTLIEDLTSTFQSSYQLGDKRTSVANYQNYYLGSVVFSVNSEDGSKSIIDGQQRITSITLLLIYLNRLQENCEQKVSIRELILSEKYGNKSFNMMDQDREVCLKALLGHGEYISKENDDETVKNMAERYGDIVESFPDELTREALPFFIDWLIENVVIVAIKAYSDENAYAIFEAMNDRGLNLTPTEMLKGYVLSKITNANRRSEINNLWRSEVQKLHAYETNADQSFFQAWFRGKYAESIRSGKAGSENKDFELIGSQFHRWFRDNHERVFHLKTSDDFYEYFKTQLPFFVKWYLEIWKAQCEFSGDVQHLYYISHWGIAESLQDPLLLSPINMGDRSEVIRKKLDYVARYIETFTVKRAVNYKKFSQASIKYTMFNVIKKVRGNNIDVLAENLYKEAENIDLEWHAVVDFRLHGQNKKFIKHLLSRITGYIDEHAGKSTRYADYQHSKGKKFEIEHIWSDQFSEYREEFDQEHEFHKCRNSIGALILLPNGTNQSFGSDRYEDKIEHYLRENTYAQTLHQGFYEKNPNFLGSHEIECVGFTGHPVFKKEDVANRNELVKRICEQLWSTSYFKD